MTFSGLQRRISQCFGFGWLWCFSSSFFLATLRGVRPNFFVLEAGLEARAECFGFWFLFIVVRLKVMLGGLGRDLARGGNFGRSGGSALGGRIEVDEGGALGFCIWEAVMHVWA